MENRYLDGSQGIFGRLLYVCVSSAPMTLEVCYTIDSQNRKRHATTFHCSFVQPLRATRPDMPTKDNPECKQPKEDHGLSKKWYVCKLLTMIQVVNLPMSNADSSLHLENQIWGSGFAGKDVTSPDDRTVGSTRKIYADILNVITGVKMVSGGKLLPVHPGSVVAPGNLGRPLGLSLRTLPAVALSQHPARRLVRIKSPQSYRRDMEKRLQPTRVWPNWKAEKNAKYPQRLGMGCKVAMLMKTERQQPIVRRLTSVTSHQIYKDLKRTSLERSIDSRRR